MTVVIQLKSAAFANGGLILKRFTCDGPNISPPLSWTMPPEGTKSLALTMDDPDAPVGTWVHWVIYDLSAGTASLPEHMPADPELDNGASQGVNDFGQHGYCGPCPPSGSHRYYLRLYALDTFLNLSGPVTKDILLAAMKDHIIGEGELMGVYMRQ